MTDVAHALVPSHGVDGASCATYIELHARSAFSFLEGSSVPEELVARAAELGQPALAILDRDNVSGAARFHMAAKKAGLRAHIGAGITCTDGFRYPLLAENRTGYQNLCRLITRMKLRASKGEGAATPEEFAEFSPGLVFLASRPDDRLLDLFGKKNVLVELQRHYNRAQEARNQALIAFARQHQLPLVATNGASHATPQSREALDVLTCVRHKVKIQEAGRLLSLNSERHLKSAQEMSRLFADLPEAIANTKELSDRLQFTLADLGYRFPRYPVPPGETMNSFLRKRVEEGARNRYVPNAFSAELHRRARRQIERELALIEKLDLSGYFLIVWDIVEFCRRQNILVQGRGSAANSAVCYSLGITAVDPVSMDLLFERFLSEERGEWPDIDLDLPSGDQRERAIQYVYQRYGQLGAAMTANVITYRGRSAVRDIGKVLGFEEPDLARISALIPAWGWTDPKETAERQFREAGYAPDHPLIAKFLDLYMTIQDLPRHLGQHSGGMVICEGQLDSVVPLEPATMPGRVVIQWDKEDCADMGIVKVDLLGLGMMAVLEESIQRIRESYSEEVDLAHLPQDDPQVYQALQNADTIGMFQVESSAQMSCLPRLRPERFYDIVVEVAIIRPGPIVGQMLNPYLRRRQGREKPECLHPALEPVLARTLGVPLFQEQLLRIAMIAANFTGGEAEELRRAMGFKRSQARMREIETRLRAGMTRNGITGQQQDTIVQSITSFALYGFPESHAASFALIAYASAYLKCHYLAAFTAAILNNQPMGFYAPATLVKDAQRHGLHFKPIDVTRSDWKCTIEEYNGENWVRLGLNYARGVRQQAAEAILRARAGQPFSSIQDLVNRVPELRKDELRKLSEIGAFNFIPQIPTHRRAALWDSELAIRPAGPLFVDSLAPADESPLVPMTAGERLNSDFRGTHLTIGRHPLQFHRETLNALGVTPARELKGIPNGRLVRIAGCVICRQRPGTAKGLLFLSLEDETGISNAVVMPDVFDRERATILNNSYIVIDGELQNIDGVYTVRAARFEPLHVAEEAVPSHDFH
ncbi:MAG TPA: error-prone DNA polymerase [Bryobacteraceae bacterium]|nr:error-prone DNA polymerase [Bryobacteraceae bacterium]